MRGSPRSAGKTDGEEEEEVALGGEGNKEGSSSNTHDGSFRKRAVLNALLDLSPPAYAEFSSMSYFTWQ